MISFCSFSQSLLFVTAALRGDIISHLFQVSRPFLSLSGSCALYSSLLYPCEGFVPAAESLSK